VSTSGWATRELNMHMHMHMAETREGTCEVGAVLPIICSSRSLASHLPTC